MGTLPSMPVKATQSDGRERPTSGTAKKEMTGVVEEVKGRAKTAVADLIDNHALKSEGEAQQDKARAQRDAAKHEAIAKSRYLEETVAEGREQAAQNRGQ
jgi:uncharacterized protein YjbJ (UPF0337 family)